MQDDRATYGTAKRHGFQPLLLATPKTLSFAPGARDAKARPDDAPRRRSDSHVRLRVVDVAPSKLAGNVEWLEAQDLLDELCEDQLTLTMKLACLERTTLDLSRGRAPAGAASHAAPAAAALRSLEARVRDLGDVRDALAVLHLAAVSRNVQPAFLPDAPLAEYLRGAYAWLFAVVRALEHLALGLCAKEPDWATYRWRIEEAKNFHFDELEGEIAASLGALASLDRGVDVVVTQLAAAVELVLEDARALEARLDERFAVAEASRATSE